MGRFARWEGALPAITLVDNDSRNTSSGVSSVTYSGKAFGTASPSRVLFVCLGHIANSPVSAVTIGGVSATLIRHQDTVQGVYYADIWCAKVPTGTSGNVVISGASGITYSGIGVYSATGLISMTPFDTFGGRNAPSNPRIINYNIDIPNNGICLATIFSVDGNGTVFAGTWSGITKDYGATVGGLAGSTYSSAHYTGSTPATGASFSCQTMANSSSAGVAASFR